MKVLWLVPVLLFSACGEMKEEKKVEGNLGLREKTDQAYTPTDKGILRTTCDALKFRGNTATNDLGTYTFQVDIQGTCGNVQQLSLPQDVSTHIVGMRYQPLDSRQRFPFSEVETSTSQNWNGLCADPEKMVQGQYLDQSGSAAVWISVSGNTKFCTPDDQHVCVMIEKGTSVTANTYEIFSREILKFQISGANRGNMVYRHLDTTVGCQAGSRWAWAKLK